MNRLPFLFTTLATVFAVAAPRAHAGNDAVVTAVFSSTSNGYERRKEPDGTFKREYYALANGQYARGTHDDPSIDQVKFPDVAQLVMQHLAKQNYAMAESAKSADLLLVISWGTTIPFDDNGGVRSSLDRTLGAMNLANSAGRNAAANANTQSGMQNVQAETAAIASAANSELEGQMVETQMFNSMRMKADERNARLLGYSAEINRRDNPSRFAGAGAEYDDLIQDIEEERYYIIISAYDFHAATQKGDRKLLWATRVSIRAQGNRFNERLKAMLANASGYFGQETNDLVRQYHSGSVRMDDLKFIDDKPAAPAPADPEKK
jgi:hypothetical protein